MKVIVELDHHDLLEGLRKDVPDMQYEDFPKLNGHIILEATHIIYCWTANPTTGMAIGNTTKEERDAELASRQHRFNLKTGIQEK